MRGTIRVAMEITRCLQAGQLLQQLCWRAEAAAPHLLAVLLRLLGSHRHGEQRHRCRRAGREHGRVSDSEWLLEKGPTKSPAAGPDAAGSRHGPLRYASDAAAAAAAARSAASSGAVALINGRSVLAARQRRAPGARTCVEGQAAAAAAGQRDRSPSVRSRMARLMCATAQAGWATGRPIDGSPLLKLAGKPLAML